MGLFDTAKKWLHNEGQQLLTADRRKKQALEAQQYQNEKQLEADAGEQVLRTMAPGFFAKVDRMNADREQREIEREEARLRDAADATVDLEFTGDVQGRLTAVLACTVDPRDGDDIVVSLEPRGPIEVGGVSFDALVFAIADARRGGVIPAGGDQFDGIEYHLVLGGDEEGFFWHESYGPGTFEFLADDLLRIDVVHRNSGSQTVRVHGTVQTTFR